MRAPSSFLVALALVAGPCAALMAQSDLTNWRDVAAQVVSRMALVRGERVLLVGVPGVADPLVPALRDAIRAAGGTDLGAIAERAETPAAWATDFTGQLGAASGTARDEILRSVDVAVMMPGAEATDVVYAAMQRVLATGRGRTVHFHWVGAYDLSGKPMPTTPDVARVYQRALLETDYARLATRQREVEAALRRGVVRVTTPAGTDVRFRIGD